MARSIQQQIDDNDAAIQAAETSQAYTARGRSLQRANLDVLYRERVRLSKVANQPANMLSGLAMQVRPT